MKISSLYNIGVCILFAMFWSVLTVSCRDSKTIDFDGGTYSGEISDGLPDGYGAWSNYDNTIRYSGFWRKGIKEGAGVLFVNDTCYRGTFVENKYDGIGELVVNDSVLYSGEWKNGLRTGEGYIINAHGDKVQGAWNNDSLISGCIKDSLGVYFGSLDSVGLPNGFGFYSWDCGEHYEGDWVHGVVEGLGFNVNDSIIVRCGIWRKGSFRGERMVNAANRIYGIDISRYQHEIGRKKYGIDWGNLRIVGLGSNKGRRVSGVVDYPVSFVYIKSTQGKTIKSRYYASDSKSARAHGIRCGAYHFFSTKVDGAEQAEHFLKNTVIKSGDLPPMLDVEPTDAQIIRMGGREALFREMKKWLDIVERRVGVRPILYVGHSFIKRHLSLNSYLCENYNVWIARYGEYKPDVRLIFWQLCPDGDVRGIKGDVDVNVFNGYAEHFEDFCEKESVP